jgi:hypothetical protein
MRLYFKRPCAHNWAEYGMVLSTLKLLQYAIEKQCDYCAIISEVDYPLKSHRYIANYLSRNIGKEFVNLTHMPNESVGKPLYRLT